MIFFPTILHTAFGVASGIFSLLGLVRYVVSIIRGGTRPSRVTWWVLALLNGALSASYVINGARDTALLPISYAIGFLIVALLSVKYGEGSWTRLDLTCFIGALIGIGVWWTLESAFIALLVFILVDVLGVVPLIYKAYRQPATEDRQAWILGTIATFLNVLAIESWTLAIALYPLYVFASNSLILFFIMRRRSTSYASGFSTI